MALREPSLLMSVYKVLLTSVRVKDKNNIYKDLRTFMDRLHRPGMDCMQGMARPPIQGLISATGDVMPHR
jgi:hypothetical protein